MPPLPGLPCPLILRQALLEHKISLHLGPLGNMFDSSLHFFSILERGLYSCKRTSVSDKSVLRESQEESHWENPGKTQMFLYTTGVCDVLVSVREQ